MKLRSFQDEDVRAVISLHDQHQAVIGRAATGLGKSIVLAALAEHYSQFGRVMVLVDVTKLVHQLADSIEGWTGQRPGIERAESRALNDGWMTDRVIVSTVQTQYSGEEGEERYRQFNPDEFSCLLLDECELFLAPKARQVIEWYKQNPKIRIHGCSATTFRTDGVSMNELFDAVGYDRDILWGIDNAWLVPCKQAFVRVSIDFSTLKVRRNDDGDKDYSDAEIAEMIADEQAMIELSKGIIDVVGDRKSIIVMPTVETAKILTDYINADLPGSCKVVYGEMSDFDKNDVMDSHRRGEFQFLCSVMMLTKGYDDPSIRAVVNCRKTRSKRLYTQILGRGVRPLSGIVDPHESVGGRSEAISSSGKPDSFMVNMVGVDEDIRDITVIDILAGEKSQAVIDRAKRTALDQDDVCDPSDELKRAEYEEEEEQKRMAEAEAKRKRRNLVKVKARVETEWQSDLRRGGLDYSPEVATRFPERQLGILRKAKVPEDHILRMSAETVKELSRKIVMRWKLGLANYKQCIALQKFGYSRDETREMTLAQASEAMDRLKANGWKR